MQMSKKYLSLSQVMGLLSENETEFIRLGFAFFYEEPRRIQDDPDIKTYIIDVLSDFRQHDDEWQRNYLDKLAPINHITVQNGKERK